MTFKIIIENSTKGYKVKVIWDWGRFTWMDGGKLAAEAILKGQKNSIKICNS
ncbi:MAG: hypothetical protein JEZ06_00140 [Anaerolineaceae bacterium]|nr:hypothetical protein [Anaerolineaceae bacterium]